jgi:hypothetical protein
MEKAIQVIKKAQDEGLFSSYAIGGGIAALFYIEPVATFALDIFIIMPESSSTLISLSPIYSWLESRGHKPSIEEKVKILIELQKMALMVRPKQNEGDTRLVWQLS